MLIITFLNLLKPIYHSQTSSFQFKFSSVNSFNGSKIGYSMHISRVFFADKIEHGKTTIT